MNDRPDEKSRFDEAADVFVDACCPEQRWAGTAQFAIIELGFGLGKSLLAVLERYASAPDAPRQLDLLVIEPRPPDRAALTHGLSIGGVACQHRAVATLLAGWPSAAPGLHRITFDEASGLPAGRRARLTLAIGDPIVILGRLRAPVDTVFVPSRQANPALFAGLNSAVLFRRLSTLMRPGALMAVQQPGPDAIVQLVQCGFETVSNTQIQPERCLTLRYAPRGRTSVAASVPRVPVRRQAIVIGAGLAGCASAAALADRGWTVTVLDQARGLSAAGGAQPLVADHLHLSSDDNQLARLTRHALWLAAPWRGCRQPMGRLQLATDTADSEAQEQLCRTLGLPGDLARAVDADEASALSGVRLSRGGLWMPACDAVAPAPICADWLGSSSAIEWRQAITVASVTRQDGEWLVRDPAGTIIARAPVVILANAGAALNLAKWRYPTLQRLRGQSTRLSTPALRDLRSILGGQAYVCPLGSGESLIGSSFEETDSLAADPAADLGNIARLGLMLPQAGLEMGTAGASTAGVGWRFSTPDRLPMIGELADPDRVARSRDALARNDRLALPMQPGLYGHFALGSRGLLWATLGAELLAAMIDGGLPPLEADLAQALDPSRFVRQRLRRGLPI